MQRTLGNQAMAQILAKEVKTSDPQGKSLPFKKDEPDRQNKVGLPYYLKSGVEILSGMAMDDVRVQYDSLRPIQLQAWAYTQGTNIYLGPGQEKHLPHEAWHVVQQKQGRVKSTHIQATVSSINDDLDLEAEADHMGAKVLKSDFLKGIRINTPPIAQSVQHEAIQHKKVPMDFGEFETTQFEEANDRGVKIKLEFKPNESKVDARKIALSQSVKAIKETGAAYATTPNIANRIVPSGKPGAGYAIDAPGSTNNPIYYDTKYLATPEELKDTPLSGNNPANPAQLGVNTNYILGYCYKEKPTDTNKKKQSAALYDMPQGRKKKGAGMQFETAAFAIEGSDKDKYYGSVKWGYKIDGTDASLTVTKMDITGASRGTPTANFIEAAKLWNVAKTQGTLKVIADPAAVYKMDLSTTETLAKGTTLKQLDTIGGGSEPMIQAEVLNSDGTGSGKRIYINVPDVKDMGDGSPNKKLPV
jgi:hypothetical protein